MDILTEIKARLEPLTIAQVEEVSAATEIPTKTLLKIKYGETVDPRIGTLQPLLRHFSICECGQVS